MEERGESCYYSAPRGSRLALSISTTAPPIALLSHGGLEAKACPQTPPALTAPPPPAGASSVCLALKMSDDII